MIGPCENCFKKRAEIGLTKMITIRAGGATRSTRVCKGCESLLYDVTVCQTCGGSGTATYLSLGSGAMSEGRCTACRGNGKGYYKSAPAVRS